MILDRSALGVVTVQLIAAALAVVPAVLLGACAGWVPAFGTLVASFVAHTWWGAREPGWLHRRRVRQNALASGIVHAPLLAAAYAGTWWLVPTWFGFGWDAAAILAPILGLGGGGLAMALTLAGGDAAAAVLGESLDVSIVRHTLVTSAPGEQTEGDEEQD